MRKTISAFVPAIFLCQLLLAQFASDTVFTNVAVMPSFGDCAGNETDPSARKKCSDKALVQFISRHLVYPAEAVNNKVEGTVYVNFIVNEDGNVQSPYLLMDIGSGCGEAAIDIVEAMPTWSPGMQNGHPVKVKLNLPVHFSLRKSESEFSERFTITWGDIVGDTVTVPQLNNNLPFGVYVRGPEGDSHYIDELNFTFEKGKKIVSATSRGNINDELLGLVTKIKPNGFFTISASIQENGRFLKASRRFYVRE